MKTSFTKRMLALLLVICLVIPMAPQITLPARAETQEQASANDPVIVVAGSDYQHTNAGTTVSTILTKIKSEGYGTIDGFLFAGDYSNGSSVSYTTSGLNELKTSVNSVYSGLADSENAIYVQGNHDPTDCVTSGLLSASGAHDTDHYGVYVINEDDFQWSNYSTFENVQPTANAIKNYLTAKISSGYTKPIFVVSHVPLHYTMRTFNVGDSLYGNLIFNALNDAAAAGLNIIFLYGHNHSASWEDSHGGTSVFYTKGDKINICYGNRFACKEETLNFTYMNAGYVGYYTPLNEGVDTTLNMSLFEITDDTVTIKRYDTEGVHVLKNAGVPNVGYVNNIEADYFQPDTTVTASPKVISLNKTVDTTLDLCLEPVTATGTIPQYTATPVTTIEEGTHYVIKAYARDWMLSGNEVPNKDGYRSLELERVSIPLGDHWYYNGVNLICDGRDPGCLTLTGSSGHSAYLTDIDDPTESERRKITLFLNDDGQTFTVDRSTNASDYLNQYGGPDYPHAASYNYTGNQNNASKWYFYALSDAQATLSVTPSRTNMTTAQVATMVPVVLAGSDQASDYTLTWSSSDPSVATVDANGFVQALKPGRSVITATLTAIHGIALTEPISVSVAVSVYSVSQSDAIAMYSEKQPHMERMTGTVPPRNSGPYVIASALDSVYKYLTGNFTTSTLPRDGLELVKENDFSHLWYVDGDGRLRYNAPNGPYMVLESGIVKLSNSSTGAFNSYTVNGDYYIIKAAGVSGSNCLNQYGGANLNTVSSYSNGNWELYKAFPQRSMTVRPGNPTLAVGESKELLPAVLQEGVVLSDCTFTWETADSSVATVADGTVTGQAVGKTTITCTMNDGAEVHPFSVNIPVEVVAEQPAGTTVIASGYTVPRTQKVTTLAQNTPYVIYHRSSGKALHGDVLLPASEGYHGINEVKGLAVLELPDLDQNTPVWYYDGNTFKFGSPNGNHNYLIYKNSSGMVKVGSKSEGGVFDIIAHYGSATSYYIGTSSITDTSKTDLNIERYLNLLGGDSYNVVGLFYFLSNTNGEQNGTKWYIHQYYPSVPVSLKVMPKSDMLFVGDSLDLTPTVAVDGKATSSYTVTWSSSDSEVASLENGILTGKKAGRVVITAKLTKADGLDTDLTVQIPINIVNFERDAQNRYIMSTTLGPQLKKVTELPQGVSGPYVIANQYSGYVLTSAEAVNSGATVGLWLQPPGIGNYEDMWYYDGTRLIYGDPKATDRYLVYENGMVGIGSDTTLAFDSVLANQYAQIGSFTITASSLSSQSYRYLNQHGGPTREAAALYTMHGGCYNDNQHNNGSAWNLSSVVPGMDIQFTVGLSDQSQDLLICDTKKLSSYLKVNGSYTNQYAVTYTPSDSSIVLVDKNGTIHPQNSGTVTVYVELTALEGNPVIPEIVIPVEIRVCDVQSVSINTNEGSLPIRASDRMKVSARNESALEPVLTVTFTNGSRKALPLTAAYLYDDTGKTVSTREAGVFTGLDVIYRGKTATTDFTLEVIKSSLPDYPDYPDEGAVFTDKTSSDTQNFKSSGLAQVELSVSGIPAKKGADVIIMLDASSSMRTVVAGSNEARINVLCSSLNNLINGFQKKLEDGSNMDIRVAVADFSGMFYEETSPYYISTKDHLVGSGVRTDTVGYGSVFTGTKTLSAGGFVDVFEMGRNPFTTNFGFKGETTGKYTLTYHSGTNYDYAFDAVYQLGEAINDANAETGEDRDLYVIFMSDGCPFQFNYFGGLSSNPNWNNWITGTLDELEPPIFGDEANQSYYNSDGKHWMAEAIKGDPQTDYPVIRKNDYRDTDKDTWVNVKGLGATMYGIGFCLAPDGQITQASMETLMKNVASSTDYAFFANNSSELDTVFGRISGDIMYAASDAYFVDQMGPLFDLKLGNHDYLFNGVATTFTDNRIEVRSYKIWTQADFEAGNCLESQLGVRKLDENGKPIYEVIECVTFNADGTEAYSDVIGAGVNILQNGIICASNFYYNTKSSRVSCDVNRDGVVGTGETIDSESFYWNVGTITTDEKALNYFVYLSGSMEGDRNAGIYATNAYANLYYKNYLGNDCVIETASPQMPWSQAQVGYGFYLVDTTGKPIVNKATGQTGSFEKSVRLSIPKYLEFEANSSVSLTAKRLLPQELAQEYRLFDSDARYDVSLNNDGYGSIAVFANGLVPPTTYITGLTSTPIRDGDELGTQKPTTGYASANTVVWFALVVGNAEVVADKTVETVEGTDDSFVLTLETYSTGDVVKVPSNRPADIVMVLDQSSTMYTPVGLDADRIGIDMTAFRNNAYDAPLTETLNGVRRQLADYAITDFATKVNSGDQTILNNAKNLGYYIAIHNTYNYIYIVQYTKNQAGQWGWYYVPVDSTVRTVEVNTQTYYTSTKDALLKGFKGTTASGTFQPYGYGTYVYGNAQLLTNVTYYQSQYGALYDTLQQFVTNLKNEATVSGLDHRVAVVGFASPFYDGWTGYDGTGIYVDGNYYLYDSDYKYVKDGTTYDPDLVFGGSTDNYSSSTVLPNSKRHTYNVSAQTYADALVSVKDNYNSVLNSVRAYKANYQQTCPSIGISIAQSIFAARESTDDLFTSPNMADKLKPGTPSYSNNGNTYAEDQDDEHLKSTYTEDNAPDREEIIILFTDGVPTVRCSSDRDLGSSAHAAVKAEFWSIQGGIDDVIDHAYEAKQAGIQIYGIGTSKAVMTQYGSDFFKHISSDDPTAESQLTVTEEWLKDSANKYYLNSATASAVISNTTYSDKGYTMYTSDDDMDLAKAFATVYTSILETVALDKNAVLQEVLSNYMELADLTTDTLADNVSVYTAKYLGKDANGNDLFSDTLTPYTNAVVEVTGKNGRYDTITVTNFDYSKEYVGTYDYGTDPNGVSHILPRGRKLVVKVRVKAREGFWGGNNVPTNKDGTAIYTPYDEPYVKFPIPQVNIPLAVPAITGKNQVVYFKEPTLDLTDLVDTIQVDGVPVQVEENGSFTMTHTQTWKNKFVDVVWNPASHLTNPSQAAVSSIKSNNYSFGVILKPKSGMTGTSNTEVNGSNIAGTPNSTDGVASNTATGHVDILVPLVTLKDSTVWIGEPITKAYVDAHNLVPGIQWLNMDDAYGTVGRPTVATMGAVPSLSIGYNTGEEAAGSYFVKDVAFHGMVYMYPPNESRILITNYSYFDWIPCTTNHKGNQIVTDAASSDAIYRHKGNANSFEFYVHVKNLQPDTVVIDYGKPVSIDVTSNDGLPGTASLVGVKAGTPDVLYSHEKDANITDQAVGAHGSITMQDGTLRYTPGDMQMNSEDVFTYATTSTALSWSIYSTVTIIPATMIYYEDNAAGVTFHTESKVENLAAWEDIGTAANSEQDQDRPGIAVLEELDADSVYGYDNSYKSSATYSNGSVHKVTVDRHAAVDANGDGKCDNAKCVGHNWLDASGDGACDTCGSKKCNLRMDHDKKDVDNDSYCDVCGLNNCDELAEDHECVDVQRSRGYCDICGYAMTHTCNARASFTFTGTGFDILSACSAQTGVVMVSVYKGEVTNFDNPPWDNYVTSYIVDTYYSYGASEGSNASRALVFPTEIYQVPVIKADLTKVYSYGDDPSTTEVESGYYYKNYGYGTYTVEIYVAPSFLEGEHAYEVSEFYLDSVRIYNPAGYSSTVDETALEAYKADKEAWPCYVEVRNMLIEQEKVNASDPDQPLIDGLIYIDGAGLANFVSTYKSWGPNNEVYLPPTCSIAFTLNLEKYGEDVAGIHLAMRALNGSGRVTVDTGKDKENVTNLLNINLGTTDQYYNIGKKKNDAFIAAGNVVVITNTGSEFIAITNIKVTHNSKPTAHSRIEGMFQSNMMTSWIALEMLDAKRLADPVVTPKYPALSYNGMICYNVFFSAEDLGDLTAADLGLAVFDSYDPEGTVDTARDVIMGATEIDGLYMVETNGVHAKYLSDTQYFRAFAKKADGSYVYSKMVSYSALDYATNVLAKSDDVKLKQLVVAMLNYGAEAQKFFGYKVDDLMNKDLTADHQALLAGFDANSLNGVQKADPAKLGAFASTGGFTSKYPAISFKGAFEINYFFTPANAVDGDMTLYFWNEDTYNSVTELTAENADKAVAMTLENGAYTASSDEIFARQLDKTLYAAAVYESNGVTYCSGVLPYSIAAYCQKPPADVQALATAAAIYGCTAKQFFGE